MPEHYIIASGLILDVQEVAYAALVADRLTVVLRGNPSAIFFERSDTAREVFRTISDKLQSLTK